MCISLQNDDDWLNPDEEKKDYSGLKIGTLKIEEKDNKAWLPDADGYSQIFRSYVFGPSGLKDYGSTMLRCKI